RNQAGDHRPAAARRLVGCVHVRARSPMVLIVLPSDDYRTPIRHTVPKTKEPTTCLTALRKFWSGQPTRSPRPRSPTRGRRSWLPRICWSRRSPSTACAVSTNSPVADFDLDAAWRLHPQVSVRPERFGALLYHFGTRRLS